jgi:TPP-dependent pyruvate/acetoin dehydrogenase alpha subunit
MFSKSSRYKKFSKKKLKKSLYFMKRLRIIEETISQEYHPENNMRCPIHLCIGQETVSSVLNLFIKKRDFLFSHHRSHGYYLSKKCDLKKLIAELYGKEGGSNKGLAGSQDISSPKNKFYAGAILSGSIGIAVGAAYGIKQKKLKNTKSVCCFGEGAIDQGIFWESINYAALKSLPIIFICENNQYATFSNLEKRMKILDIQKKVSSFGVKTLKIFGNDFLKVYKAIEYAFNYNGPVFIEANTYRISSHVGPEDDSKYYRDKKEIENWKKKCPIKNVEKYIKLSKKDINNIKKEVSEAFKYARKSKFYFIKNWEIENVSTNKKKYNSQNVLDHSYSTKDTIPEPY